jgi:hypothetical protein
LTKGQRQINRNIFVAIALWKRSDGASRNSTGGVQALSRKHREAWNQVRIWNDALLGPKVAAAPALII